jgi:hypothetical protein
MSWNSGPYLQKVKRTLDILEKAIDRHLESKNKFKQEFVAKAILEDEVVQKPPFNEDLINLAGYDNSLKLDAALKDQLEYLFNADLSKVRIHTGKYAEELARKANAYAITIGSDIYFGLNKYEPDTADGIKLLIHELQHVIQNERGDRLVYNEDIQKAEHEANISEDAFEPTLLFGTQSLLDKSPLPSPTPLPYPNYFRTDPKKQVSLEKSNTSSGSLDDFNTQNNGIVYQIILKNGEEVELTPGELDTVFEEFKKLINDWISDQKAILTTEEYDQKYLKLSKLISS